MRIRTRCFFALMGAALLTACSRDGHVVEKDTNRPLEGVVVVTVARGTSYGVVQNSLECFHLAHGRSDARGEFSVPGRLMSSAGVIQMAYKAGYHEVEISGGDDRIVMERNSDSPDVRFEQILKPATRIPVDCPRDEVKQLVEPILRPALAELMPLVRTQSQREKADDVLGKIEFLTVGDETATTNSQRRRAEWRAKPQGDAR